MCAVAILIIVAVAGTTSAATRPDPCTGGRFVADAAPLLVSDTAAPRGPLAIADGRVSVGTACPPVRVHLKSTLRGTSVRARWPRCTGLRGAVRLTGTIAAGCDTMRGTLVASRSHVKRGFTGRSSICGDGVVDPGMGEQCEGDGCDAGTTCVDCRCVAVTTTSTTMVTSTSATSTTVGSTSSSSTSSTATSTSSTTSTTAPGGPSVARQWNEDLISAIRLDTPRPTVHARNLFHLAAAMWDAWAAYDDTAAQYFVDERATASDVEAARAEAISYAAYGILRARYADSVGAVTALAVFDAQMDRLGYDRRFTSTDGPSAAALGNRIAAAVLAYGADDGANEGATHTYADPTYAPVNPPLVVKLPTIMIADPNRWQPLALDFFITQNGIPEPTKVQTYIGAQWGNVRPYALVRANADDIYLDPGPPPYLGGVGDDAYRANAVRSLLLSSHMTPDDGVTIDISPGAIGNNPLGTNDGMGYAVNPVTGEPYAPNVVKRGDWARVLAEFWADGPNSETPPGHWNVIANAVTDQLAEKRIGGAGAVVNDLEWDVKLYLALDGAEHDAAIGCWGTKRKYDYVRPISMVRWLASLGQSSDAALPHYDARGLPLVPDLIELITPETTAPGQRHAALAGLEGEIAVNAWPGQPASPETGHSGRRWVLGTEWVPYQKSTFVTPAFAAFTSGHSTFSRAGAEVLTAFTGTPYFPGGLGHYLAPRDTSLTFERGPSEDVDMQWATYYDAADAAGLSRLYGGIHVADDDFNGRIMGSRIGIDAMALARKYFDGTVRQAAP